MLNNILNYFSMKTEKCYMEDKKTHEFPNMGAKKQAKWRHQIMSWHHVWFRLFLSPKKVTVSFGWEEI